MKVRLLDSDHNKVHESDISPWPPATGEWPAPMNAPGVITFQGRTFRLNGWMGINSPRVTAEYLECYNYLMN